MNYRKVNYKKDAKFLYEIVKQRWSTEHTNVHYKNTSICPTYDEHVKYLNTDPWKHSIIIYHKRVDLAVMYITQDDYLSLFFLGNNLKQLLRHKQISKKEYKEGFDRIYVEFLRSTGLSSLMGSCNPNNKYIIAWFEHGLFEHVENVYKVDVDNFLARAEDMWLEQYKYPMNDHPLSNGQSDD